MNDWSNILLVGMGLFSVGFVLVLTRRNVIMALMGIELMLNAANLNFVSFARFDQADLDGQMASLFVMVLAAAEVAIALAIILLVYKRFLTIRLDKLKDLS